MAIRLIMLLASCLSTGLYAQYNDAADTPDVLMQQAQTAFDRADIVTAMALYRKAAETDYAPAQARLAYLLDKSEANEEAVDWYRSAAGQGYAEGMFGLAGMLSAGEGIEQNLDEAINWYTLAAQQGYRPAIRLMARAYETGDLGLDINHAQSVSWLNAGVAAQDAWCIQRLARAFRRGELGQRIDMEQAAFLESRLSRITPPPANVE